MRVLLLRDRLLFTLQFVEQIEDFPSGPQFRAVIEECANKNDLRSLRLLKRDIDEMTLALSPADRSRLTTLLRETLGVDDSAEEKDLGRYISAALERGAVASEKDRRRLERYIEYLEVTNGDLREIDAVQRLLAT